MSMAMPVLAILFLLLGGFVCICGCFCGAPIGLLTPSTRTLKFSTAKPEDWLVHYQCLFHTNVHSGAFGALVRGWPLGLKDKVTGAFGAHGLKQKEELRIVKEVVDCQYP